MCVPLANEGVGLGPSSSGPVASRPPLGDWSACGGLTVMLFTWAFPCVGLPHMGSLLAALPEVRLPGMGCWCPFRVPQILCLTPLPRVRSWLLVCGIAVRTLLLATSLSFDMDVSLVPGRCLSASTFYGLFSILKVLVLKCRVLPFS